MDEREQRAENRRRTWQGFVSRNGEHPPMGWVEPELALSVMWETAVEAWRIAGNELPEYERHQMPGRVFRHGEKPDE